jgi:hypothetical protein
MTASAPSRVKVTVVSLTLAKFLLQLGPLSADGLLAAVDEHWPDIAFADFRTAFALSTMLRTDPSRVRMLDGISRDEVIDLQEWLDQAIVLRSPSVGSA